MSEESNVARIFKWPDDYVLRDVNGTTFLVSEIRIMIVGMEPKEAEEFLSDEFEPAEGRYPKVSDVFGQAPDSWHDVPVEGCELCSSKGFQDVECEECNGLGQMLCTACEREGDCCKCGGSGEVKQKCSQKGVRHGRA